MQGLERKIIPWLQQKVAGGRWDHVTEFCIWQQLQALEEINSGRGNHVVIQNLGGTENVCNTVCVCLQLYVRQPPRESIDELLYCPINVLKLEGSREISVSQLFKVICDMTQVFIPMLIS